ncbi:MAG: hypothetical protein QM724_09175 [Flavobacteriales bacterium]
MKSKLLILSITGTLAAHAQNSNVVSAFNYLSDKNYEKAIEYIEPATTNEASMGKEKTWRYRGDIYRQIALSDDAALKAKFPDALQKAIESYTKANELDAKGSYKEENMRSLGNLQVAALNGGNDAFNTKDYDKAITLYGESERIAKAFGQVDSNAVFNSALAYESKGDLPHAIERYKECIKIGYNKADVYRYLAHMQKQTNDQEGAIATTRDGLKAHPGNKELMLDEVAYLLDAGHADQAETSVKAAIEKDPNNPSLYSVLGSLYDAKANPKEGTAAEADMLKYYDLAEGAYKKALELDANNFDAAYNVGVLYNNRAAYEYEKCGKLKDDAAYLKCKKTADEIYTKAVPFFEKAHAMKADDKPTMQQLKKLYAMMQNTAKFEEMKKLLGE